MACIHRYTSSRQIFEQNFPYSVGTRYAPLGNWKPLLENETSLPTSWSAAIIHVRLFFHCVPGVAAGLPRDVAENVFLAFSRFSFYRSFFFHLFPFSRSFFSFVFASFSDFSLTTSFFICVHSLSFGPWTILVPRKQIRERSDSKISLLRPSFETRMRFPICYLQLTCFLLNELTIYPSPPSPSLESTDAPRRIFANSRSKISLTAILVSIALLRIFHSVKVFLIETS